MAALATYQDVEARWRPLTPSETSVAETLLDDASDILRTRWPDVDSRLTSGSLTEATVVRVVATMVKRALMSAGAVEGVESSSQTAGPFAQTVQYANPTGNLYISADEARLFDGGFRQSRVGWLA